MDCIYEEYDMEGKHCKRSDCAKGVGMRCRLDYNEYCSWYTPEKPTVIDSFQGNYDFLSNFYESRDQYIQDDMGLRYKSVEAAFQATKTLDKKMRKVFTELSPSAAKYLGRHIQLREDWEQIKDTVMYQLVMYKFTHCEEIKELLLETDDIELIEGNWWNDTYWGVCKGVGQNKLGKILMEIREKLK